MYFSQERNARIAAKLFEHIKNTTTDQADGILEYDLSIYADPALVPLEHERIFERAPIMAAHSSQIPNPGDYLTLQLNKSSVLLTRTADGSPRAFLNICRHRGAKLVKEQTGSRRLFTCPYHGWSYSNDGALRAITFPDTFGATPCAERNLVQLPVEERHGFVWIVENPDAKIDVAAHLEPGMDQALAEYGFDKWFCYKEHVFEFPQNWKVMMDGLIDGYHVHFLHGATIMPYFYPNIMAIEVLGPHALWGAPRRAIDKILHETPGHSSLDTYAILGNLFLPNTVMVLHPHHIEYWTVYQNGDDPKSCRLHLRYLTPQKDYDEKGHARLEKNWKIAVDAIVNEDIPVGDSIQA
ncbi:MAG: aromatic ring-hydroxylating dioxygenase subunit alpha, partial [Hyphomonadaceae bacterium]